MDIEKTPTYEHLREEEWDHIAPLLRKYVGGFEKEDDIALRELWSVLPPSNRKMFIRAATDPTLWDELKKIHGQQFKT